MHMTENICWSISLDSLNPAKSDLEILKAIADWLQNAYVHILNR
jgi:hypothetical protein